MQSGTSWRSGNQEKPEEVGFLGKPGLLRFLLKGSPPQVLMRQASSDPHNEGYFVAVLATSFR